MSHRVSAVVATVFLVASTAAIAAITPKIQRAFRGQIMLTAAPLPDLSGTDAETIDKYKSLRITTLKHEMVDGTRMWHFNYTAFLKKAPKGAAKLSFDFYTDDKEKLYVANKNITGFDPKLMILTGNISIGEEDNLNPKRSYILKLTGEVRGREIIYATTKVSTD